MKDSIIDWQLAAFTELLPSELYAALQLRSLVFVVEQNCVYLDADGYDDRAYHLLGWIHEEGKKKLVAYARIFEAGIKFREASIGRVITHPDVRRGGLGKALMEEAIRIVEKKTPGGAIRIGAQCYLERFYNGLGFRRDSEPYDEDGIPHIEMLRVGDQQTGIT